MTMAAKITIKDGSVTIVADEGSTVRNVRVAGKRYSVGREVSWTTVLGRALFYLGCLLFCVGFWYGVFMLFAKVAHGQTSAGSCELVKDADQRHYCRACSGRPGECEFIKSSDLRQTCRALCKPQKK